MSDTTMLGSSYSDMNKITNGPCCKKLTVEHSSGRASVIYSVALAEIHVKSWFSIL